MDCCWCFFTIFIENKYEISFSDIAQRFDASSRDFSTPAIPRSGWYLRSTSKERDYQHVGSSALKDCIFSNNVGFWTSVAFTQQQPVIKLRINWLTVGGIDSSLHEDWKDNNNHQSLDFLYCIISWMQTDVSLQYIYWNIVGSMVNYPRICHLLSIGQRIWHEARQALSRALWKANVERRCWEQSQNAMKGPDLLLSKYIWIVNLIISPTRKQMGGGMQFVLKRALAP